MEICFYLYTFQIHNNFTFDHFLFHCTFALKSSATPEFVCENKVAMPTRLSSAYRANEF